MRGSGSDVTSRLVRIETKLEQIEKTIEEMKRHQEEESVTKAEIEPLKKFVYGLITIVGTAVVSAMIGVVLTVTK